MLLITQINMSHVTKECIGHIEPSIHHMTQTAIKSLTTQKMIDKHIQPGSFTTPLTYPPK